MPIPSNKSARRTPGGIRRGTLRGLLAALCAIILLPLLASEASARGRSIPASFLGMNYSATVSPYQNSRTGETQTFASSVRFWGSPALMWLNVEPARGTYNWAALDAAVSSAQANGSRDIMYVAGMTPAWAATSKNAGDFVQPGTASPPANPQDYGDYIRAVAQRYKGRITSYECWNEAALTTFWRGSASQMVALTKLCYKSVRAADPKATVLSAGVVASDPRHTSKGWFDDQYLRGLRSAGWPIHGIAASLYPQSTRASDRVRNWNALRGLLNRDGAKKFPVWEVESNFVNGPYTRPCPAAEQIRLVAVSYIQAAGFGVARSYWYSFNDQILCGRMTNADGTPTATATAFETIRSWMSGKRWAGCKTDKSGNIKCAMSGGTKSTIAYRNGGKKALKVSGGTRQMCTLNGACVAVRKGQAITVTTTPILLVG